MEIVVVRSGGFAGMTRRGTVDTDQLGDRAPEWLVLIDEARPMLAEMQSQESATANSAAAASPVRDGFVWTLSVGNESCAQVIDSALTGPLRELAQKALKEGTTP